MRRTAGVQQADDVAGLSVLDRGALLREELHGRLG